MSLSVRMELWLTDRLFCRVYCRYFVEKYKVFTVLGWYFPLRDKTLRKMSQGHYSVSFFYSVTHLNFYFVFSKYFKSPKIMRHMSFLCWTALMFLKKCAGILFHVLVSLRTRCFSSALSFKYKAQGLHGHFVGRDAWLPRGLRYIYTQDLKVA